MGLGQTQERDINTHMYTHPNTFSHPLTVNPFIKGGNWSGGSANMVCCVIKVRVFVQQGPVPRDLIVELSGEMCPLTPAGSNSLIVSPGTGHCASVCVLVCKVYAFFYSLHGWQAYFVHYTVQYFVCMLVKACTITTGHFLTDINQRYSISNSLHTIFESTRPRFLDSAASLTLHTVEKCL